MRRFGGSTDGCAIRSSSCRSSSALRASRSASSLVYSVSLNFRNASSSAYWRSLNALPSASSLASFFFSSIPTYRTCQHHEFFLSPSFKRPRGLLGNPQSQLQLPSLCRVTTGIRVPGFVRTSQWRAIPIRLQSRIDHLRFQIRVDGQPCLHRVECQPQSRLCRVTLNTQAVGRVDYHREP